MNRNQHYEFWVSYFDNIGHLFDLNEELKRGNISRDRRKAIQTEKERIISRKNASLTDHKWVSGTERIPMQEQSLCFEVLYPGLLIGLGNAHDSHQADGEFNLGFTFDPVTGLPYLPGSSVKGILRSAFLANWEYVKECLGVDLDETQIKKLELDIFGNYHKYDANKLKLYDGEAQECEFGIGNDIFFDAYPVKAAEGTDRLIGIENITPHLAKNPELQGLTNPIPLTLLKIMPGVVIQFRFRLADSKIGKDTIDANQKLKLFTTILEDFGAGAKTNVGFGALKKRDTMSDCKYLVQKPEDAVPSDRAVQQRQRERQTVRANPHFSFDISSKDEVRLNMILKGRVNKINEKKAFVTLGKNSDSGYIGGQVYYKDLPCCKSLGEIGKYLKVGKFYRFKVTKITEQYGIDLILAD